MREKMLCAMLAGLLAVGLSACGPVGEGPDDPPALSRPVETVMPSEEPSPPAETVLPSEEPGLPVEPSAPTFEPPEVEFSLPERKYQPWQTAYMDFLTALRQAYQRPREETDYVQDQEPYEGLAVDERGVTTGEPLAATMALGSDKYSLYDVDKDGVPELFVSYWDLGDIIQCYAFRDGRIVCVGEFYAKDSSLYEYPKKSAVLCHWGRMGSAALYEYDMVDGVLAEWQELFTENVMDKGTAADEIIPYTAPDEIVPGAASIQTYYTRLGERDRWPANRPQPSEGKALLLPVCDWYEGLAATGDSSEQARTAILAALAGEQPLYGASGDHFYGDVGWTAWEEYIQPGAAYPYSNEPFQIAAHVWLDMNGDGQEECVVRLEAGRDEEWSDQGLAVLSEQDGTVYAYYFGFYESAELGEDGVFYHIFGDDGYNKALSFWQDQCYEYDAAPAASAKPVEWLDGSPTE